MQQRSAKTANVLSRIIMKLWVRSYWWLQPPASRFYSPDPRCNTEGRGGRRRIVIIANISSSRSSITRNEEKKHNTRRTIRGLIKKSDKNPIILNVRVCFSLLQIEYVLLMKQFCVIPDSPMVSAWAWAIVLCRDMLVIFLSLYKTWTTIQTTSSLLIFCSGYWTKYFCECNRQHIYNCDCIKNEGHFLCDNFY